MEYENDDEIPDQTAEMRELHAKALRNFDLSYSQAQEVRSKVVEAIRFVTVPGAMWEGGIGDNFQGRPKMEQDLISREIARIYGEYTQNRVTVNYRPADDATDDKQSELLDGMFRADMEDCDGQEATDSAIMDALKGGFGAIRLCVDEDEEDELGEERSRIKFEPIYDAADSVWFDPNSKKADKSDAEWAMWLQRMTLEAYKDEFGKTPASFATPDLTPSFGMWFTQDWVYVAKYYVREEVKVKLITFVRPDDGDTVEYDEADIEDVIDDLIIAGYVQQSDRKVKRKKVRLYCLDGDGVLEDEGYIAGAHIPLIPCYGKRSIVDGVEYCEGITQKAIDSQRVHNMNLSLLADAAAQGAEQTPIADPEQIKGLESFWAQRFSTRQAYLPLRALKDKAGNVVAAGVQYLQPPQISPAMASLIDVSTSGIQQITGANPSTENAPANTSNEAIQTITRRADTVVAAYFDQFRKFFKRIGIVYLSMAREVYSDQRQVRVIAPDGSDSLQTINQEVIDGDTGRQVVLNDLSKMKFNVAVDVGPSYTSQRDQTADRLEKVYLALPDGDPKKAAVLAMWIDNLQSSGLDDLKRVNRRDMLVSGITEPRDEEEQAMIAQAQEAAANQPPDPQQQALQAMAQEAMAKAEKAMAEAQMPQAEIAKMLTDMRLTEAKTAETLAKVDQKAMANMQTLADMIQRSQDEMITRIAAMFQQPPMTQPVEQPMQTMEVPQGDNPQV